MSYVLAYLCLYVWHLVCLSDNSADGQMTVDTALVMLQTESSKAEDLAEASVELDMQFYMSSSGSFLLFQHVYIK